MGPYRVAIRSKTDADVVGPGGVYENFDDEMEAIDTAAAMNIAYAAGMEAAATVIDKRAGALAQWSDQTVHRLSLEDAADNIRRDLANIIQKP